MAARSLSLLNKKANPASLPWRRATRAWMLRKCSPASRLSLPFVHSSGGLSKRASRPDSLTLIQRPSCVPSVPANDTTASSWKRVARVGGACKGSAAFAVSGVERNRSSHMASLQRCRFAVSFLDALRRIHAGEWKMHAGAAAEERCLEARCGAYSRRKVWFGGGDADCPAAHATVGWRSVSGTEAKHCAESTRKI